jgi:signal peptidase II
MTQFGNNSHKKEVKDMSKKTKTSGSSSFLKGGAFFKLASLPFFLGLLGVDQWTKLLMLHRWTIIAPSLQITPFFNISFVWNRGISFGFFKSVPWITDILLAITLVIILLLGLWFRRESHRLTLIGLGLVLTGAIGNFIDRLRFGAVIDFLHFYWDTWHFPTFNIADAAITCGIGLLLYDQYHHPSSSFFGKSLPKKTATKKESPKP